MARSSRKYEARDLKLLFGRAGGMCSAPGCRTACSEAATEADGAAVIGQVAHIVGFADEGPRGDPAFPVRERDKYANLILLCGNCHAKVDQQEKTYPPELLRRWKHDHERWVASTLTGGAAASDDHHRAGDLSPMTREPRTPDSAPSVLLRPEHEVVPFVDLNSDRAELRVWANGPVTTSARVLAGAAGTGKTRLAQQVCLDLAAQGWTALLVGTAPTPAQVRAVSDSGTPLLLVIDHAELRVDEVAVLAAALAGGAAAKDLQRRRLLLVTRSTDVFLRDLRDLPDGQAAGLFRNAAVQRISAMPAGGDARRLHFDAAHTAFVGELGHAGQGIPAPDLADCRSVLEIHATALCAVLGGAQQDQSPLAALARHDQRHWAEVAGPDDGDLRTGLSARVRALATLLRPGSPDKAEALAALLPGLLGVGADRLGASEERLARVYPRRYPFCPAGPDAYDDQTMAATLAAEPWIAVVVAATCTTAHAATALTVLGRALPEHPELGLAIRDMVRRDPGRLVLAVADIVGRLPEPSVFARTVSDALSDVTLGPRVTTELAVRLGRGGSEFAPLRGLCMQASMDLPRQLFPDEYRRAQQDTSLAGFTKVADAVNRFVLDLAVGAFDPGSGRMPQNDDGSPVVPPQAVEFLGTFLRNARKGGPGPGAD